MRTSQNNEVSDRWKKCKTGLALHLSYYRILTLWQATEEHC